MLQPALPAPPHALPNGRRAARIRTCAAGLAALAITACVSPGMKMTARPSSHPSTMNMDGMKVTLRRLDTQAIADQASPAPIPPEAVAGLFSERAQPYRIGPQDVLLVTVWDHPEITLPLGQYRTDSATGMVVDEDGYLYFPYVGRLLVSGLTVSEARTRLTQDLTRVLQKPQVDLKVIAFRSQKVFVGGEVKTPGVYNVTDVPFTLAEAVNRSGGFLPTSDDSRLLLTRGSQKWYLDFQGLLTQGNRISKLYLKDGDSLQVPSSTEFPVYMMGEVTRPGSVPMNHGHLTLAKAISDSGGILGASADARSIYVIRRGQVPNDVNVYHLDARNPTAMTLADRFELSARDLVYVDAGTVVRFGRVMSNILPTFTAIATGAIAAADIRYLRR